MRVVTILHTNLMYQILWHKLLKVSLPNLIKANGNEEEW